MKTKINGIVETLDFDAIESVWIKELPSMQYDHGYRERPSRYMIKLYGENRKRRVYAQPLGNVSVLYFYTNGKRIYCESALDAALHRKGN